MWPASASTTIPSGIGPAEVTMTFLSEPSGFTETMRPPLASRKNRRGPTAFRIAGGRFDLGVCVSIIVSFLVFFRLLLWSPGFSRFFYWLTFAGQAQISPFKSSCRERRVFCRNGQQPVDRGERCFKIQV